MHLTIARLEWRELKLCTHNNSFQLFTKNTKHSNSPQCAHRHLTTGCCDSIKNTQNNFDLNFLVFFNLNSHILDSQQQTRYALLSCLCNLKNVVYYVLYVDSRHVYTDRRQVHVQQHVEQLEELFESPRWLHARKGVWRENGAKRAKEAKKRKVKEEKRRRRKGWKISQKKFSYFSFSRKVNEMRNNFYLCFVVLSHSLSSGSLGGSEKKRRKICGTRRL